MSYAQKYTALLRKLVVIPVNLHQNVRGLEENSTPEARIKPKRHCARVFFHVSILAF